MQTPKSTATESNWTISSKQNVSREKNRKQQKRDSLNMPTLNNLHFISRPGKDPRKSQEEPYPLFGK